MKQNIFISIISCVVLVTNYHKAIAQFASQDLSNLTWPTKINFSLLPDSTNKQNLGLSNKSWKDLYLGIRGTVYLDGGPFLSSGETGIFNVMLGGSNGPHSAASYNTFLGCGAGKNNLKADNNTFVGALAGNSSVSGKNNSFFGMSAGYYNATGNYNSFFTETMPDFLVPGEIIILFMEIVPDIIIMGILILFLTRICSASNKNGLSNSFFGSSAGASNTTGNYNSFFGMSAGAKNYDGLSNSFFGSSAGGLNISGFENTSLGNNAGYSDTSSPYNVCVGSYSGYPMTGTQNTYIGTSAGRDYTTGNYNTCVGINAGYSALFERTGSSNTMIGGYTRVTASHSNSTALGYEAVAAGDNAVGIGNTSTTSIGGYQDWSNFSDGRYKKEIKENVPGLAFVNQLKPITYHLDVTGLSDYLQEGKAAENSKKVMLPLDEEQKTMDEKSRKEKEKILYTGFVAQDVEAAAKKLNYDFSGVDKPQDANGLYKLRYAEFVVPLVKLSSGTLYTK